jgi:hypothetical protein
MSGSDHKKKFLGLVFIISLFGLIAWLGFIFLFKLSRGLTDGSVEPLPHDWEIMAYGPIIYFMLYAISAFLPPTPNIKIAFGVVIHLFLLGVIAIIMTQSNITARIYIGALIFVIAICVVVGNALLHAVWLHFWNWIYVILLPASCIPLFYLDSKNAIALFISYLFVMISFLWWYLQGLVKH